MPHKQLAEEHLKYLNIDTNSKSELRKAKDVLEPAMDKMLDNLYHQILENSQLDSLHCNKAEIEQIQSDQKKHLMEALFDGKYDDAYYEKTSRIGRAHARIGLTPNWYLGGYNRMLCQFNELILTHYANDRELAISLTQAISNIIFLDIDLVIHSYLEAKDESMRRMLGRSTELRAEMWRYSDELNSVVAELNSTAETLSEDTQNQLANASTDSNSYSRKWNEVYLCTSKLLSQAKRLRNQTSGLDEYLKKLPLYEKLYLPEAGFLTKMKNRLLKKRPRYEKTSFLSG